jgi:hypothetical protein
VAADERRHRALRVLAVLAVAWLAACGREGNSARTEVPVAESPWPSSAAPGGSSGLISADGIGAATRGLTFGALRAALAPDRSLGEAAPDMVDIDGVPVIAGRDTLYLILVGAGVVPTDGDPLETVITSHPGFRTAEGVGPGTTLGEAAQRYGAPTLSYNVNDESREYAWFPGYPADNVLFRVGPDETTAFAGTYGTREEVNTTTTFDADARIRYVLVGLR